MPALIKVQDIKFMGLAVADKSEWANADDKIIAYERKKAAEFVKTYGGVIFESYKSIIESKDVDAIYLPLPPALHYKWAKLALESGKHVLVEKPATTSLRDTAELISIAQKNNLALHENYMFVFHDQLEEINTIISNNDIGDIRLYRIAFGFPRRSKYDFRYNKALGGGALLDAGGYTLKYASMLLGSTAKVISAHSNYIKDFDVDINGSATLVNDQGVAVQVAFGMDNSYKCDLEIWGSRGTVKTGRVLTAPPGFSPDIEIKSDKIEKVIKLPADDSFRKSIEYFRKCILDNKVRIANYHIINIQAGLIDSFLKLSN